MSNTLCEPYKAGPFFQAIPFELSMWDRIIYSSLEYLRWAQSCAYCAQGTYASIGQFIRSDWFYSTQSTAFCLSLSHSHLRRQAAPLSKRPFHANSLLFFSLNFLFNSTLEAARNLYTSDILTPFFLFSHSTFLTFALSERRQLLELRLPLSIGIKISMCCISRSSSRALASATFFPVMNFLDSFHRVCCFLKLVLFIFLNDFAIYICYSFVKSTATCFPYALSSCQAVSYSFLPEGPPTWVVGNNVDFYSDSGINLIPTITQRRWKVPQPCYHEPFYLIYLFATTGALQVLPAGYT